MKIIDTMCLYFITICHFLIVCFVTLTPFFESNYLLFMHSIVVPFIMVHWILNNNTCVLSTMEKKLRYHINGTADPNECFTCKLINPIYDFNSNYSEYSAFIYITTTLLWFISIAKLYNKYRIGEINTIMDLFKY